MFNNCDWLFVGVSLVLLFFSLLSIKIGLILLKKIKKAEQLVRQQVTGYEELLRDTSISWLGRLYANIFTPKTTRISVRLAAYMCIVYGGVMTIAALIGIFVAMLVEK